MRILREVSIFTEADDSDNWEGDADFKCSLYYILQIFQSCAGEYLLNSIYSYGMH